MNEDVGITENESQDHLCFWCGGNAALDSTPHMYYQQKRHKDAWQYICRECGMLYDHVEVVLNIELAMDGKIPVYQERLF
jgi:hypothetical protein